MADPKTAQAEAKAPEVYWAPLSVWKITTAMLTAAWASSAAGWRSDSAKPRKCPREQILDGCKEHRAPSASLAGSARGRENLGSGICWLGAAQGAGRVLALAVWRVS